MRLSDCAQNRDNNFNLIRALAAVAVLIGHCCALTGRPEPGVESLEVTFGTVAVDIFFVSSGFLVTGSLLRVRHTGQFLWVRALRLLPGLWVMLLLSVGVLGPIFTRWPLHAYFAAPATLRYLVVNATLVAGIRYRLPGVFLGQRAGGAVNGSLWTLPDEVFAYVALAVLWFLLSRRPDRAAAWLKFVVATLLVLLAVWVCTAHFLFAHQKLILRHLYMFFAGVTFSLFRDRVVLTARVFWLLTTLLLLSTADYDCFFLVYPVATPYLLFYLAYVPGGFIRRYNRLGDYSYGIYIYAFPIQQITLALCLQLTPGGMMLVAFPATLLMAALSWRLVEEPALRLKRRCVSSPSQVFTHGRRLVSDQILQRASAQPKN